MEQPITVKYRWSADDMFQGYRYALRQHWRPMFRAAFSAAIYIVAVLCVVAGIVAYCRSDFSAGVIVCPLFGLLWLFRVKMLRWFVRWRFARRPDRDMVIEWGIAPDKLMVRSPVGHSEISWKAFVKVVRTPSGIMLYPLKQIYHYLPRRGFASDAEFEQVAALAQSRVQRFRVAT